MWFDNQFEKNIQRLSNHFFNWDDVFENQSGDQIQTYGPYYYGYQMTVGPDGKPHVREWGNVRPTNVLPGSGTREPYVDEVLDEKNRTLKLVAEMPGIEKSDIKVNVVENTVSITAEHDKRKYQSRVPLKNKVDENSAKAQYSNGVLELTFKLAEEKPKGKLVAVD
ncbi:MAG: archaeal heat shock protein Hsp20 [Nitrosopumilaceae archaeon]